MSTYRVINPHGEVVATKEIGNADDAHAWFVDNKADKTELGWRMEVDIDGDWRFFDQTDGDGA
ncbi:hypothetical protein [Mycobacterium persicum]|uniref:Uncharacterized protein n=1 Tax=Mycobacterium persicum TaxID=1487726 RepID=A0A1X0L8Z1_9MYCO|nr:hypothetical protein [Mycobacterium persicum]KZS78922.1 hypothetical protein A4G31_13000 [Mycobacterium persicum]ORB47362.1 hypothetical protein BST40_15755 [Mycobacterium persicum]ORB90057.1 hypothetical protein B1T49_13485 [Mycobacterium persicum]ORB95475.1 hypothetical protein B1T44_14360 [Mycobacterium persicum]ORC02242.1 hypothetical protein B1T48_14235 [Mycobacterium persicum]